MKSLKTKFLLIASLLAFTFVQAQSPFECGGVGAASTATRTVGCTPTMVPYTTKYGRISWHVPSPSLTSVKTVVTIGLMINPIVIE